MSAFEFIIDCPLDKKWVTVITPNYSNLHNNCQFDHFHILFFIKWLAFIFIPGIMYLRRGIACCLSIVMVSVLVLSVIAMVIGSLCVTCFYKLISPTSSVKKLPYCIIHIIKLLYIYMVYTNANLSL